MTDLHRLVPYANALPVVVLNVEFKLDETLPPLELESRRPTLDFVLPF